MAGRNIHPEDIKATVRKTGITLAALARQNGLSTSVVRKSLYRPQPSGNRAIATYLGRALHELWPEWFDKRGNRIPSTSVKNTNPSRRGHCQKWRAA